MTKKDYIRIAKVLSILRKNVQIVINMSDKKTSDIAWSLYNLTVDRFCNTLSEDNPKFDNKRFIDFINK